MRDEEKTREQLWNELKRARREISEQRRTERADKHESLGAIAAGIAHDFNNLLVAIQGNAHLALMDVEPRSTAHPLLEEIQQASARAGAIADQMLASAGKGRFSPRTIHLFELILDSTQRFHGDDPTRESLSFEFEGEPPSIRADPDQIRQVVGSLVANAFESLDPEGGAVHVRCGVVNATLGDLAETYLADDIPPGRYARLEVRDNGCGMAPDELKRIFDPFYTTKFPGRGLGLASTLGIVRRHRGALKVFSDPSQGTTIQVLLPLAKPRSRLGRTSRPGHNGAAAGKILVVDDEVAVRMVARRMLERRGFEVLDAASGAVAVEIFRARAREIAAIVLDLSMPAMDGEVAFQELRRIRDDIPVIFMSGHSEQEIVDRLFGKQCVDFVKKPFSMECFIETVTAPL